MKNDKYYPRVLIIHLSKVKADDACNLLIRTQFGEWPKEKLAQIHSTAEPYGEGEFCSRYYKISSMDRRYGEIFSKLRISVNNNLLSKNKVGDADEKKINLAKDSFIKLKHNIANILIDSGIWEAIFSVKLSDEMQRFVNEFNPEIIFCHGSTISFATISLLISKKYNIPICIQNVDDWAYGRYVRSPARWLLRKRAKELIDRSAVRLVFGEKMRRAFEDRYGVKFNVTYHLDDIKRFEDNYIEENKKIKIIYTGSLELKRHEALYDLLLASRKLDEYKGRIKIEIYTSNVPVDIKKELIEASEVQFYPLPKHNELPSILSKGKILFLPESFNQDRKLIEYSISTKAHLYMMSKKCIVVYGPKYSGTVSYAENDGWALVVKKRNIEMLKEILLEAIAGGERVEKIINNSLKVVSRNHEIGCGKERFYKIITSYNKADKY
jgi:glycosyltransferase involved in cell wall biosynthesis